MIRKFALIFALFLLFSSCSIVDNSENTAPNIEMSVSETENEIDDSFILDSEPENSNQENTSMNNNEENEKDLEKMESYPLEGLTLTDFSLFSFKPETTQMSQLIERIGEANGLYNNSDPYYILYDGTTMAFKIDGNGYIYEPYITDVSGRVFRNGTIIRESLLTEEEILQIKSGEYMPSEFSGELSYTYHGATKLSISNFTKIPFGTGSLIQEKEMWELLGPSSGESGSGEINDYYQLIDGTVIHCVTFREENKENVILFFTISDVSGRGFVRKYDAEKMEYVD